MKTRIWFIVLLWAGIGLSALGQEMTDLPQGHPRLEKPRDFDPFGQAGLSPLATI